MQNHFPNLGPTYIQYNKINKTAGGRWAEVDTVYVEVTQRAFVGWLATRFN